MTNNSYEFTFAGKLYVAYYEVGSSIAMVDRRINEVLTGSRLFSSYSMRKELLNNLCAQRDRMIIDGLLAGSIHEVIVESIIKRKAA